MNFTLTSPVHPYLSQNDSRIGFYKFAGRNSASDDCGDVYRGPNYGRTSIVLSGWLGGKLTTPCA